MGLDAEQILKRCYDSEKQALRIATDGLCWTKYTYTMGSGNTDPDFAGSGTDTSEAINGPSLPAGTIVHAVKVKPAVKPAGTSLSAAKISVGITGTATKYVNQYEAFVTVEEASKTLVTNDTDASEGFWMENHSSVTQVVITLETTNCHIADLTAGTVDIWLLTSVAT